MNKPPDKQTVSPKQIEIPVSWGTLRAQVWGSDDASSTVVALHGWLDNSNSFVPILQSAHERGSPLADYRWVCVDMAGHGYATVRLSAEEIRTEFVCIPRPLERSESADGGPLRYRVVHQAQLWRGGELPRLAQQLPEGETGLAL